MREPEFKYRSVFISDLHLGSSESKAKELNDFLKQNKSEYLYLVGDILDLWRILNRRFDWPKHWTQEYNNVVRRFLSAAKNNTKVVYITGNHDEYLRIYAAEYNGKFKFGNIKIVNEHTHKGVDGKKYLVLHGDQYDVILRNYRWLSFLSNDVYTLFVKINNLINKIKGKLSIPKWSLSKYIGKKSKNIIYNYENLIIKDAKDRGFDGIICGHVHLAEIKHKNGIIYMNTGDWVGSMTALVERYDGGFEVVNYEKNTYSNR